jgi:hypothetical protein
MRFRGFGLDGWSWSSEERQVKGSSGRQPKSPAFENREDRGSLSWDGVGKEWAGQPPIFWTPWPMKLTAAEPEKSKFFVVAVPR